MEEIKSIQPHIKKIKKLVARNPFILLIIGVAALLSPQAELWIVRVYKHEVAQRTIAHACSCIGVKSTSCAESSLASDFR